MSFTIEVLLIKMNYTELNEFIKNYIENDRTNRAIMLTGSWGCGKSYYIKNELQPFLKANGNHKCVVISLYGISDLSEISKSIYIELRTIRKKSTSEASATVQVAGKIVGKTILKNILKTDVAVLKDDDFNKVYQSVNLDGKLVIFEDIERTKIDMIEFLGYVNNLCEQDNVKVLLVANENEILKYNPDEDMNTKLRQAFGTTKDEPVVSNSPKHEEDNLYWKAKEKTVGDTIYFKCDFKKVIGRIIAEFQNEELQMFNNDDEIQSIKNFFYKDSLYNFRALKYAFQKTIDVYEFIKKENISPVDKNFKKNILYSMIILSQNIGKSLNWKGQRYLSFELGLSKYPLFRFCDNYIKFQKNSKEDILQTINQYKEFHLYSSDIFHEDADLSTIYSYDLHSEQDIKTALISLETKLRNSDKIPLYEYGKLASYIVCVEKYVGINTTTTSLKSFLVENLKKHRGKIDTYRLFWKNATFDDDATAEERFKELKEKMILALQDDSTPIHTFTYKPEQLQNLENYIWKSKDRITSDGEFISLFNIEKLVELFFKCNPKEMDCMQGIFIELYHREMNDIDKLADLKLALERRYNEALQLDSIQKLQYERFVKSLEKILNRN